MTKHLFAIAIGLSIAGGVSAVAGAELQWLALSWIGSGLATIAALVWGIATVNGGRRRE